MSDEKTIVDAEVVEEPNDFERRVKMLQVDLELLQKKHKVGIRPIITPYGPDLQLIDISKVDIKK